MKSIFSKIIDNEIPCHLIAQDKHVISFMDINPIQRGHVLVVPKQEIDYLFDLDSDTYNHLWMFTKKVASALKKTIDCERIGVSVIGLEVPHAHIHLIPIKTINDMSFNNKMIISREEMQELSYSISQNLN